jgi:hypothetical protein
MVAALTGEPVAQSQQIEEAKHVEQDVTVVESEDTGAGKRGE